MFDVTPEELAAWAGWTTAAIAVTALVLEHRRAREVHGFELAIRLSERLDSPDLREARREAAQYMLLHYPNLDECKLEPPVRRVMAYFEGISIILLRGAIDDELMYHMFKGRVLYYYNVLRPFMERERQFMKVSYRQFPKLYETMVRLEERERNYEHVNFTTDELREFLQREAQLT